MSSFLELCEKEVVSVKSGKRIGYVDDMEIDDVNRKIKRLIVFGRRRMLGLAGREPDITILLDDIVTLGDDIILVKGDYPATDTEYGTSKKCVIP